MTTLSASQVAALLAGLAAYSWQPDSASCVGFGPLWKCGDFGRPINITTYVLSGNSSDQCVSGLITAERPEPTTCWSVRTIVGLTLFVEVIIAFALWVIWYRLYHGGGISMAPRVPFVQARSRFSIDGTVRRRQIGGLSGADSGWSAIRQNGESSEESDLSTSR